MRYSFIFLTLFFNSYLTYAQEFSCKHSPRPIQTASESEIRNFQKWHKAKNKGNIPEADYFIADINNDGRDEIIIEYNSDNALWDKSIFSSVKNDYKEIVNIPEDLRKTLFRQYNISKNKKLSITFVKACDKTFIRGYLWEKGITTKACSKYWQDYDNSVFLEYYKKREYVEAYSVLNNALSFCEKEIAEERKLRILNDLALTSMKSGDFDLCLRHIEEINKGNAFASSPKDFKLAVNHNKGLCENSKQKERLAKGKSNYDYSWPLEFKGKSLNNILSDKRLSGLFEATVPEITTRKYLKPGDLRQDFELRFSGPPDDVLLREGRYLTLGGCIENACASKGMLWVDVKQNISVGVLLDTWDEKNNFFLAVSKNINFSNLPSEFYTDLKDWLISHEATPVTGELIGYDKKVVSLNSIIPFLRE